MTDGSIAGLVQTMVESEQVPEVIQTLEAVYEHGVSA